MRLLQKIRGFKLYIALLILSLFLSTSLSSKIFTAAQAQEELEAEESAIEEISNSTEADFETPPTDSSPPIDNSTDIPLPNFNILIADLGASNSILTPGSILSPIVVAFDQDGNSITRDDNLSINFTLDSGDGNLHELIPQEECTGIRPCLRQIPPDLAHGNYNLQVTLNIDGQDSVTSDPVAVNIGEEQFTQDPDLTYNQSDLSNGPCYGDSCPEQEGAKVIPLSNLYTSNPIFDTLDGTTVNMIADCTESPCLMPASAIYTRYSQAGLNLEEIDTSEFEDPENISSILDCIKSEQNSPTSVLNFINSLSMIIDSFPESQGYSTNYLLLKDSLAKNILPCSSQDIDLASFQQFGQEAQAFLMKDRILGDFTQLENSYQSQGHPMIIKTKYQQSDPHYAVLAGITNNYVWLVDPQDPNQTGDYTLRFNKDDFINLYYDNEFIEIEPASGNSQLGFNRLSNTLLLKSETGSLANLPQGLAYFNSKSNNSVITPLVKEDSVIGIGTLSSTFYNHFTILGKDPVDPFTYKVLYSNPFYTPDNTEVREGKIYAGRVEVNPGGNNSSSIVFSPPLNSNLITSEPPVSARDSFLGVRIKPQDILETEREHTFFAENMLIQQFYDLNRLGVGAVRIVINEAKPLQLNPLRPVIDKAIENNYFIVFHYTTPWRLKKDDYSRYLKPFLSYIKQRGLTPDRFAIELGNEPNDSHQYFEDCRAYGPPGTREDILHQNAGRSPDHPFFITEGPSDCTLDEYLDAFSEFIHDSSETIWSIEPDTKLIIGALGLQGGSPQRDLLGNVTYSLDQNKGHLLDIYMTELAKHNDLSRFDFAVHAYTYWDSGQWDERDGLLHVYNAYLNNPIFQQTRGEGCRCIWVTEFGFDQRNESNLANLLNVIEQAKLRSHTINKLFFHEFNGSTEIRVNRRPEEGEHWQFWDRGRKYPLYNILQFKLLGEYIKNGVDLYE